MFIHAILLPTLTIKTKEAANGHPRIIILVKESTSIALHTKAAKPVAANGLAEAPAGAEVSSRGTKGFRSEGAGKEIGEGGRGRGVGGDEG